MTDWLVPLLRCPTCGRDLAYRSIEGAHEGSLEHTFGNCLEKYPVINGIPRLIIAAMGGKDPVVAGFDDEWHRFDEVGTRDQADLYALYFDLLPPRLLGSDQTVLDAGCGAGRWAFAVSSRGPRVVAIDLGRSVEITRSNTDRARVACVQADVEALPLGAETVDWAYSLGVLHHIRAPERALADIVKAVRPGGVVLLYLYYALDQRGPLYRTIFHVVDITRRLLSHQPRFATRAIATVIAALLYWPLARAAALLERLGAGRLAMKMPLAFYRRLSFRTMRNDSIDRFGTRLERRYTRAQMTRLMEDAGLVNVVISDSAPFWHGVGTKQTFGAMSE